MRQRSVAMSAVVVAAFTVGFPGHLIGDDVRGASRMIALTPAQMVWSAPNAAGTDSTVLWGDRSHGQQGTLSHYTAGSAIEPHFHTNDMRGLIVSGTWVLGIVGGSTYELPAGSYFFLPGKTVHTDRCQTSAPCLIFLMQEDGRDLIPVTPMVIR